ncbi:MAG: ABC transporter substrate-binding protein [Sporichthyaceae bacterium]
MALAGCAGSTAGDDAPAAPTGGTTAAATSGTRAVAHDKGVAQVPVAPARVVVLDSPHLDAAIALGVVPVGSTRSGEGDGLPAYLADRAPGVQPVGTIEEPNLEAIAAMRPDVILSATVRHDAIYGKLSQIAPTVFTAGSGTNWRDGFALVAEALNRAEQGRAAVAEYDAQADRTGSAIGAQGKRAAIVRFLPEETRIYGPSTFSGSVLTDVGYSLPALSYDEYSMVYISPERIDQADGDVLFATTYGSPEATSRAAVAGLWGRLPAVANGCQFDVADDTWMLGIGLVGAKAILADLESFFGPDGACRRP